MTLATTHQYVCDLCGEDIGEPARCTLASGLERPVERPSHALFRGPGCYLTYDLCAACSAPLLEALGERITVLQAEGRIRSAA